MNYDDIEIQIIELASILSIIGIFGILVFNLFR